jgi:hypothetical protein
MRKQVKFVFQIGYPTADPAFERAVIQSASSLCGGCTTSGKQGWWKEDGASHAETFSGRLVQEHCFELELTCEQAKAERVYAQMCEDIALAALAFSVDTNWVHVTETEMTGRHFSVAALTTKFAA